jgi:hypothetical protein
VPSVAKIAAAMRANPRNNRYDDLAKVCEHYFGPPARAANPTRYSRPPVRAILGSTSRSDHGQAKAYQVRQVLAAIDKLEGAS